MLSQSLENLNEDFFKKLCSDRYPESGSLDFKCQLPNSSDKEKEEFLKDVCAFANSDGGDLVYGIMEGKDNQPHTMHAIETDFDNEFMRLSSFLERIEPFISGIKFKAVTITGGFILIVRVPSSFNAPHGFNKNDFWKFAMRNGPKTTYFTYEQLRSAFDRSATLAQQARAFLEERHDLIINKKTLKPLCAGPICVTHLIPISGLANRHFLDVKKVHETKYDLTFRDWGNIRDLINLDGVMMYAFEQKYTCAYVQAFRNGSLEGISSGAGTLRAGEKHIPCIYVTDYYRESFIKFKNFLIKMGYAGPAVASFALLNIEGYDFPYGNGYSQTVGLADRSNLILRDIWIEDISAINTAEDADIFVRPAMDILWQCFSAKECELYDANGIWKGKY